MSEADHKDKRQRSKEDSSSHTQSTGQQANRKLLINFGPGRVRTDILGDAMYKIDDVKRLLADELEEMRVDQEIKAELAQKAEIEHQRAEAALRKEKRKRKSNTVMTLLTDAVKRITDLEYYAELREEKHSKEIAALEDAVEELQSKVEELESTVESLADTDKEDFEELMRLHREHEIAIAELQSK